MDQVIVREGKKLRLGYTTGTCAAAASKAAAWMLLTGRRKDRISILTPKGITLDLKVHNINIDTDKASCSIEKDSGDDPDITRGIHIFAAVEYSGADTGNQREQGDFRVSITAGQGVGVVTRPGLDQKVGEAAINSIPRKMICENVEEVMQSLDYKGRLKVTISAPEGERLAAKTFNPRLGITGGISILGTTGIVEPMSEDSIIETIRIELRQKRELGSEYALIAPGNYGMDFIREYLPVDPGKAVMVSNFIGDALDCCADLGYSGVLLVGHIGKLVKLAGGMMNTHSKYGDCRMEILAANAAAAGLESELARKMLDCATCDDALNILRTSDGSREVIQNVDQLGLYEKTLDRILKRIEFMMDHRVMGKLETGAILFSRESGFLCETSKACELLGYM